MCIKELDRCNGNTLSGVAGGYMHVYSGQMHRTVYRKMMYSIVSKLYFNKAC